MNAGEAAGAGLARLLDPRAVAIIGASDKPGALGTAVLDNLERNGFAGAIHLVNPGRAAIGGRPCLPDIAALPDGVDAAVLAIPRAALAEAIRALAVRRVGAAVIFAAGFAEEGEAGLAEQRDIATVARAAGMVVEGPNCLGLVNHRTGAALTFVRTSVTPPAPGRVGIGIVSQSGAMAAVLGTAFQARGLPLTLSVSTGNEAVSGVEDYLAHLVGDPATRVIAMVVEQFRAAPRFLSAARAARAAGQTIVLLHPGRSRAARESAATHTGALAGDHDVMRLLVGRAGVVLAETLEELGDVAEIALRCPVLPSRGVAVMGESGAFKALTLDLADALGLALPTLADADSPALRAALPPFVGVSNPLDLTAQGLVDPDLYRRVLAALIDDARIGAIVVGLIQTDPATLDIKLPPLLTAARAGAGGKPIVFTGLDEGAGPSAGQLADLRDLGIACFPSSERALRAVARLVARPVPTLSDRGGEEAPALAGDALDLPAGIIPEYRAKALLAPLGFPFPASRLAATADEACAAAATLGYPVVLKAQSPALGRKSDAGGVALGLADADAVRAAWHRMVADVARHLPDVRLDGLLVEATGPRGLELILGARRDADWGPVVLAGIGGVHAEVLRDLCLIAPDADRATILAALRGLKAAAVFDGWRGAPAVDLEAVAVLVQRLGATMLANPRLLEIDLNPVVALAVGDGVVALDALMVAGTE